MEAFYSRMNHKELHEQGLKLSKTLMACETRLIEVIGNINLKRSYLAYGCKNVYEYAEKYFQIKQKKTFDFIKLFECSKKIPELKEEIKKGETGYTKLRTIQSAIEVKSKEGTRESKKEIVDLIEKTKTHSRRDLEKIARDIAPLPESTFSSPPPRYLGNNKIERIARLTKEQEVLVDRAFTLIKCEEKKDITFEKFLEIVCERVISNRLKAGNKKAQIIFERDKDAAKVQTSSFGELEIKLKPTGELEGYQAAALKSTGGSEGDQVAATEKMGELYGGRRVATCPGAAIGASKEKKKKAIPQGVKDIAFRRDGGKCIHCGSSTNLDFHHLIPQYENGTNQVSNIYTLCRSCHNAIHSGFMKMLSRNGKISFEYKDKNITSFTDYLFNQKVNRHLNYKYSKKPENKIETFDRQLNFTFI